MVEGKVFFKGELLTRAQVAERSGLSMTAISYRLRHNIPLTVPRHFIGRAMAAPVHIEPKPRLQPRMEYVQPEAYLIHPFIVWRRMYHHGWTAARAFSLRETMA